MLQKKTNVELDLALLHKSNFHYHDNQNVISINDGKLVLQPKKQIKVNAIDGIAAWTDAFVAYIQILLIKHETKAIELLSFMGTIREAANDA